MATQIRNHRMFFLSDNEDIPNLFLDVNKTDEWGPA